MTDFFVPDSGQSASSCRYGIEMLLGDIPHSLGRGLKGLCMETGYCPE